MSEAPTASTGLRADGEPGKAEDRQRVDGDHLETIKRLQVHLKNYHHFCTYSTFPDLKAKSLMIELKTFLCRENRNM